jgi:DNA-binding NtrC family response regulator
VHGIVKQSHGYIWVDSEPARGATFTILLPSTQPTAKPVHQPAPTEPESFVGSETILLVEDNAPLLGLACKILRRFGYRVLTATSAEAALDLCAREENIVDLLITDVVLPGLSGPALADELKARWPQLRTLLMSGYTDDNMVRHAVVDGRRPFLQKPFSPETIARKVRMVFDSPA